MMSCGAILQGNLADRNEVLKIQKKIIRIMAGVKKSGSFMILFRRCAKMVLCWGYCHLLWKTCKISKKLDVHSLSTWHGYIHMPDPNPPEYQTRVYYTSILLISSIPYRVQSLNNNLEYSSLYWKWFLYITSVLLMNLQQLKILQLYKDVCYFLN